MTDNNVFLFTEIWLKPGAVSELKAYRKRVLELLEEFEPEFIFHNHPYEWVLEPGEDDLPTGMDIIKFRSENIAKQAISKINAVEIKKQEQKIFYKIRSYLGRYAPKE